MKRIFSILALAAVALFSSCDKIDPNDYLIFGGASGTWYEGGEGVADHTQRAFLEKYTGIRCVNCPDADVTIHTAMEKYGEDLIVVGVHGSNYFGAPINGFDPRCEDGRTWLNELLGAEAALPSALLMRNISDKFSPIANFDARIDAVLAQSPAVAVAVSSTLEGNTASIMVNLEFLQDVSDDLSLTLFLMEDGVIGPQKHTAGEYEEYEHNHILRDVITDIWGIDVPTGNTAGTKRFVQISYPVENAEWNTSNCKVVAFVGKKSDKSILNAAETRL